MMSSEAIVVLVIVALAIAGLVYLEMHSRKNKRNEEEAAQKSDE
jgi:flagellar basal body-associated protein FliL